MKLIHRLELTQEELSMVLDYARYEKHNFRFELTDTFQLMSRDPVIYVFKFSRREEKL